MTLRKRKHYFKKPKSKIAKDVLKLLLISGTVVIAASSPYLVRNFLKGHRSWSKYSRKKVSDTFSNLRRKGLIDMDWKGNQIYIHLTKEGMRQAGRLQIDDLKIKKPKKWDKKWRVVIFDIAELKKTYREAFRGKIKELGFCQLQKSVWIHPFDCKNELKLLKEFFGLSDRELRIMVVESLENDKYLKKIFSLS